jgi:hypothetical protein
MQHIKALGIVVIEGKTFMFLFFLFKSKRLTGQDNFCPRGIIYIPFVQVYWAILTAKYQSSGYCFSIRIKNVFLFFFIKVRLCANSYTSCKIYETSAEVNNVMFNTLAVGIVVLEENLRHIILVSISSSCNLLLHQTVLTGTIYFTFVYNHLRIIPEKFGQNLSKRYT